MVSQIPMHLVLVDNKCRWRGERKQNTLPCVYLRNCLACSAQVPQNLKCNKKLKKKEINMLSIQFSSKSMFLKSIYFKIRNSSNSHCRLTSISTDSMFILDQIRVSVRQIQTYLFNSSVKRGAFKLLFFKKKKTFFFF